MTTFIQLIAFISLIIVMIFVAKWQVDDEVKEIQKRLDDARKEINGKQKL